MRGRGRIDQASYRLRNIRVMPQRQPLTRRKAPHYRDDVSDMRITVAIHKRKSQHPYIETVHPKEKALRGEFALRIRHRRHAGIIL